MGLLCFDIDDVFKAAYESVSVRPVSAGRIPQEAAGTGHGAHRLPAVCAC